MLSMKTIFHLPASFCGKADSNHCWFAVPVASVMLPLLTQAVLRLQPERLGG